MKEYDPEPLFENRRNGFVVTFFNWREFQNDGTGDEEATNLLDFCRQPRTRREIADYLGIKTTFYAYQTVVCPLVKEGKLAMTIPDKSRRKTEVLYPLMTLSLKCCHALRVSLSGHSSGMKRDGRFIAFPVL